MAYAALLSLSQTADLILRYHQKYISPPARDQIISISEYVIFLQVFLEDFPEAARRFEAVIRAVAVAAEDIIEFFMSAHIYQPRCASSVESVGEQYSSPQKAMSLEEFMRVAEREGGRWFHVWQHPYLLPYTWDDVLRPDTELKSLELNDQPRGKHKHLRYDFEELKEAKEQIESIAERMKNYITANDVNDSAAPSSSSRVAPPQEDVVVGLEGDVLNIKSLLCGQSTMLQVVPIVGMGGIGKTTLAINVYNDKLIMEHFDVRAWVTVSQVYRVEEIVSSLLASMRVFTADSDPMKQKLLVYQHLKGRRFLIVLDDIWSVNAWDDLNMMFPDDGERSRVVLTTRLLDVASYVDSSNLTHVMHVMNEDRSWDLLQRMVFKHDPCPIKLENMGKTIARRCRGLPLAIVVISGILSIIDQTEAAWNIIAENVKSAIHTNEEQVDNILSLSYAHLPHHLRPLFLYIASFPEDYEMRVSKLIRLWMAEGLLKPSGSKSLEETGEEYLENLVKRSLVFVTTRKANGRIKRLGMHDLIRDTCIRKAEQENLFHRFLGETRKIPICISAPHVSRESSCVPVILMRRYLQDIQLFGSLRYYRLLRILDLLHLRKPSFSNSNLPSEIFELFHLRYLAFHCFFGIPAGISNLQNLQTFIIYSSRLHNAFLYLTKYVPFLLEIWSMPQLRHLHIDIGIFFCLPPSPGEEPYALENLHTLSVAINFVCTPALLNAIPNLKKLKIRYSTRDDEEDYQLNNLMYLQQLENLKLSISQDFPFPEKVKPAFPSSLKNLSLHGLELPWEALTVVGSLPNLEVLKLRRGAYVGDTWETTEGEFLQLRFLLIDFTDLENWITESSHFPLLKCLVLYRCPCLYEIPDDIGEILTLELIEVDKWNSSLVESAKQIGENQQACGNNSLRVRIVKAVPVP